MRIGLDVQTIGRRRTGDETYYRNLISHYAELGPGHEYWFYYTHPDAEPVLKRFNGRHHDRRLALRNALWRVPLAYPWQMLKEPVDVFHTQYVGFAAAGARLVLTVHDLSFEHYPRTFPAGRALWLKLTRWSVRAASAVIAVSEHTKNDLVRRYGLAEEKVRVIHNAAHPRFAPGADPDLLRRLRARWNLRKDFLLCVCSDHPRKNLPRLLAAFERASRRPGFDWELVLAGPKPDPRAPRGVVYLGYVPDEELPALYNAASAFVYPSLYEGFGLPPLEAMSCGTPVIASRSSSLPEVCADAALYVDPTDVEDMARALARMAEDPSLRARLKEQGLRRARLFSWREAARRTLAVYEEVGS